MNKYRLLIATCALVAVANAQNSPENHAAHHPTNSAVPATGTQPQVDLQKGMQDMQALMEKIEKTKHPAERQLLLDQHRQAMDSQMHAMRHMETGMDPGMHMGMSDEKGMGMQGGMKECHEKMQRRMDMMLGMMEQVMRHEEAEHDQLH